MAMMTGDNFAIVVPGNRIDYRRELAEKIKRLEELSSRASSLTKDERVELEDLRWLCRKLEEGAWWSADQVLADPAAPRVADSGLVLAKTVSVPPPKKSLWRRMFG